MIRTYIINRKELEELKYPEDILSESRREKISRLKRDEDKQLSACAELLLIYAVRQMDNAALLPLSTEPDERGKLTFKELPYFFNLSHARDYASCAISDKPIGVDIEYFRVKQIMAADMILHPEEAAMMSFISNPDEKKKFFYECWVAKESYLKNLGIGLIVRPRDFMVSEDKLKILDRDFSEIRGHHSVSVNNAGSDKNAAGTVGTDGTKKGDNTLHENLSYLEKRYVHVFEPGEVRGSDWKFDTGYRMAICSEEKDPDSIARQIHAADIESIL